MFENALPHNISLAWGNTYLLTLAYFIISTASVRMIPKHNIRKFVEIPKLKIHGTIENALYIFLLLLPVFIPFSEFLVLRITGIFLFLSGIIIYLAGIVFFAISEYNKPVTEGIYKIIKHPVYTGFSVAVIGTAIAGGSIIYLFLSLVYIINNEFLKKEEERSCTKIYPDSYKKYAKKVKFKSLINIKNKHEH